MNYNNKLGVLTRKDISKYFAYLFFSSFIIDCIWELISFSHGNSIKILLISLSSVFIHIWIINNFLIKCGITFKEMLGTPPKKSYKQFGNLSLFISIFCLIVFSQYYLSVFIYAISHISSNISIIFLDSIKKMGTMYDVPVFNYSLLIFLIRGILVVIIVPVYEEIIYRGIILNNFKAKWGINKAILFSSFLFGVLHFHLIIGAIIFSIFLSLLYFKTKSLYVVIFVHMLNNFTAFLLDFLDIFIKNNSFTYTEEMVHQFNLQPFIITGITFFIILIYIIKNWPIKDPGLFQIKKY